MSGLLTSEVQYWAAGSAKGAHAAIQTIEPAPKTKTTEAATIGTNQRRVAVREIGAGVSSSSRGSND